MRGLWWAGGNRTSLLSKTPLDMSAITGKVRQFQVDRTYCRYCAMLSFTQTQRIATKNVWTITERQSEEKDIRGTEVVRFRRSAAGRYGLLHQPLPVKNY